MTYYKCYSKQSALHVLGKEGEGETELCHKLAFKLIFVHRTVLQENLAAVVLTKDPGA